MNNVEKLPVPSKNLVDFVKSMVLTPNTLVKYWVEKPRVIATGRPAFLFKIKVADPKGNEREYEFNFKKLERDLKEGKIKVPKVENDPEG